MSIRVNMKELTPDDLVDASEIIYAEFGMTLTELNESPKQAYAAAAFATVVARRTNPEFTFAQARKLPMGEIDVVTEADPPAASNGGPPQPSLASGV